MVSITSCSVDRSDEKPSVVDQHGFLEEASDYGGELFTIESDAYQRFILAENTTYEYMLSATSEYCALASEDNFTEHYFGFTKHKEWVIVLIPKSISFYTYHNLIGWFWGYGQDAPIPTEVYGVALHESDSLLNYYAELDQSSMYGDELIGGFQNGDCHHINTPEAFEEGGNIKLTAEVTCNYTEIKSLFKEMEYDLNRLPSRDYKLEKIELYE
jgi:hypothetical protein